MILSRRAGECSCGVIFRLGARHVLGVWRDDDLSDGDDGLYVGMCDVDALPFHRYLAAARAGARARP